MKMVEPPDQASRSLRAPLSEAQLELSGDLSRRRLNVTLRTALARSGLKQKDLAVQLKLNRSSVSRMLSGSRNLTIENASRLLRALDCWLEFKATPISREHDSNWLSVPDVSSTFYRVTSVQDTNRFTLFVLEVSQVGTLNSGVSAELLSEGANFPVGLPNSSNWVAMSPGVKLSEIAVTTPRKLAQSDRLNWRSPWPTLITS